MTGREPTWSERIQELIEEVDRIRTESERVRGHAERAMRGPRFWPDRRRQPRPPSFDPDPGGQHDGSAGA